MIYKMFLSLTIVCFTITVSHPVLKQQVPFIVSFCIADIDMDTHKELIAITSRNGYGFLAENGEPYGSTLEIYRDFQIVNGEPIVEGNPAYAFDLTEIKPLFVQAGDINGDGINEIAVCVYKTTPFHDTMAMRPFFYDLVDGALEPVWLGSRLARPFTDYRLFDVNHDGVMEIVSIEKTQEGGFVLAAYDWDDFGFVLKSLSGELHGTVRFLPDIEQLCIVHSLNAQVTHFGLYFEDDAILLRPIE